MGPPACNLMTSIRQKINIHVEAIIDARLTPAQRIQILIKLTRIGGLEGEHECKILREVISAEVESSCVSSHCAVDVLGKCGCNRMWF